MGPSKYKFFITHNALVTEVFPLNMDKVKFQFQKDKDKKFFKHRMNGQLIFVNVQKDGITDFDYFWNIEQNDQCAQLEILVQQLCGGVYQDYWRGTFGTSDGKWDLDRCRFEITPEEKSDYNCLLSDIKFNVLDIATITTVFVNTPGIGATRTYDRCRAFDEMLDFLATQTCPQITGIVSDFFQINPETVSTTNYVTGEFNTYTQMQVSQKSDVKEPIAVNEATKALHSFKQIADDLRNLFNVWWFVDVNGNVRFEHEVFFASIAGFDLTVPPYSTYIAGTNKYEYDRQDSPRYETWSMPETSMGARITYDNACGNDKENESQVTYNVTTFYTDYTTIRFRPLEINNLEGLFLFATVFNGGSGNYDMYGFIRGEELILGRLVLRFHRHGRPQLQGTLEYFVSQTGNDVWDKSEYAYEEILLFSAKKTKKQRDVSFPLCCDDNFDPNQTIKTFLGTGIIGNAEFDPKTSLVKVQLLHGPTDTILLDPDEITGLQLWLKADAGVIETLGFVSTWEDQSGNGNDATQAVAGQRPTRVLGVLNGLPVIRFDGVDDGLQTASVAWFPNKRGTVFVVLKPEPATLAQVVGTEENGVGQLWDISLLIENAGPTDEFHSVSEGFNWKMSDEVGEVGAYAANDFILFNLLRPTDTEWFAWLNGKRHRSTTNSNPMPATGQPDPNPLNIANSFAGGVSGRELEGDIAEIIIYDRALTNLERQHVEQYLFRKYKFLNSFMLV